MPLFSPSWEEIVGTLPPAEQAEILALISGHPAGERDEDDSTS